MSTRRRWVSFLERHQLSACQERTASIVNMIDEMSISSSSSMSSLSSGLSSDFDDSRSDEEMLVDEIFASLANQSATVSIKRPAGNQLAGEHDVHPVVSGLQHRIDSCDLTIPESRRGSRTHPPEANKLRSRWILILEHCRFFRCIRRVNISQWVISSLWFSSHITGIANAVMAGERWHRFFVCAPNGHVLWSAFQESAAADYFECFWSQICLQILHPALAYINMVQRGT